MERLENPFDVAKLFELETKKTILVNYEEKEIYPFKTKFCNLLQNYVANKETKKFFAKIFYYIEEKIEAKSVSDDFWDKVAVMSNALETRSNAKLYGSFLKVLEDFPTVESAIRKKFAENDR